MKNMSVKDIIEKKKIGERIFVREVREAEYEVKKSGLKLIRSKDAEFEIIDDFK